MEKFKSALSLLGFIINFIFALICIWNPVIVHICVGLILVQTTVILKILENGKSNK